MDDKFLEYLQREVPYWEKIAQEDFQKLKSLYEEKEKWSMTWGKSINLGLKSQIIDYENDVEKNRVRFGEKLDNLRNYVNALHTKYNYVKPRQDNQAPTRK